MPRISSRTMRAVGGEAVPACAALGLPFFVEVRRDSGLPLLKALRGVCSELEVQGGKVTLRRGAFLLTTWGLRFGAVGFPFCSFALGGDVWATRVVSLASLASMSAMRVARTACSIVRVSRFSVVASAVIDRCINAMLTICSLSRGVGVWESYSRCDRENREEVTITGTEARVRLLQLLPNN